MAGTEEQVAAPVPTAAELSNQFVTSVYRRFDSTLRGFLMNKLGDESAVEDLVQEVYLRFSRLQEHNKIRCESAFLIATARNLLRDRSRRWGTKLDAASVCADDVVLECTVYEPLMRTQYAEQLQLLQNSLDKLSNNCRKAFWMNRVDGKKYAEIASEMSVSVSAIEKYISAALTEIRTSLT